MDAQYDADYLSAWNSSKLICVQMAMRAAIELNVFNIIAEAGPGAHLSPSEMVAKMPTTNPNAATALDRILGILGANSILSMSPRPCSDDGKKNPEREYGLMGASSCLVADEDGVSLAPLVLSASEKAIVESFYLLKDAVLEEGCMPFKKAHGLSFYEYMAKEPRLSKVFNQQMATDSTIFFKEVFKVYKGFDEVKELMDVGGGIGTSLSKIVSKYPHIRGINFDLPHIIADAPSYPGVEHVAGDMFEGIPTGEPILLKSVLHNWDNDKCVQLLKNCWKALPDGGTVIVVESVLPPVLGNNFDSLFVLTLDFLMLALIPGGKERTIVEHGELAKAAGFDETKSFPIPHGYHVIEFHKKTAS